MRRGQTGRACAREQCCAPGQPESTGPGPRASRATPSSAVVILAAGEGKRMRSSRSKLLHEIAGHSMLSYAVDAATALQPEHIVVVVGHLREQVEAPPRRDRPARDDRRPGRAARHRPRRPGRARGAARPRRRRARDLRRRADADRRHPGRPGRRAPRAPAPRSPS